MDTQLLLEVINTLRSLDYNNVRVSGGKSSKPKRIELPDPTSSAPKRPAISLANNPAARPIPKR